MQLKFNPVILIFTTYLSLGAYLVYAYFDLSQTFARISVVDLSPLAFGVLVLAIAMVVLSLFSLLRIPVFHYLFNLLHLWVLILLCLLLWLHHEFGHLLSGLFSDDMQQGMARVFPVSDFEQLEPIILFFQKFLSDFRENYLGILLIAAFILVFIQVILYLPSSLRYVYHSDVGPVKYTIKHMLLSIVFLAPVLYAADFFLRLDTNINPDLEALLSEKTKQIAVADNAFYPMLTLWQTATPGQSSNSQSWLDKHRTMVAYFKKINKPVIPLEYPKYRELRLAGMDRQDQSRINQLYVRSLTQDIDNYHAEVTTLVQRYATQLETLQVAYTMSDYSNPLDYVADSYTYYYSDYSGSYLALLRLSLLDILMRHAPDDKLFVKSIRDDYFYNLRIIKNSSDVMVKRMHLKKQAIIIEFLNFLLQKQKYQTDVVYGLVMRLPLLVDEVIDNSMIAKRKMSLIKLQMDDGYKKTSTLNNAEKYLIDYTFKYNKTMNCIYKQAIDIFNLDNKSPLSHIKVQSENQSKPRLDNLIGNIICHVSIAADNSKLYSQAIETKGRMMVLKARSQLLQRQIPEINVNAFLTNNSQKYNNPFDGSALKWQRQTRKIYFEYHDGEKKVQISM